MATAYPDQVNAILRACIAYQNDDISLEELKSELWTGAQTVLEVGEAEFRRYLQAAEARLDIIQFTTEDVRGSAAEFVREIEAQVRRHLEA